MANTPAMMGFIGQVVVPSLGTQIRATSCSLNAKQTIDHPDVIDGATDWSIFQLRGIEVDGDVAFPVLNGQAFITGLMAMVARDGSTGQLVQTPQDVTVYYDKVTYGRKFSGCSVNTFEIRATAGERVDATINFWGRNMTNLIGGGGSATGVLRVLSWADIAIGGAGDACKIREFSISVNNSLARNYTFCAEDGFFPNNISAGKRQVNGTLGFLGPAPGDIPPPTDASGNAPCTPTLPTLTFSLNCGVGNITVKNVVFEYQTLEAQPGVIVSTVNWFAHSAAVPGDSIS